MTHATYIQGDYIDPTLGLILAGVLCLILLVWKIIDWWHAEVQEFARFEREQIALAEEVAAGTRTAGQLYDWKEDNNG